MRCKKAKRYLYTWQGKSSKIQILIIEFLYLLRENEGLNLAEKGCKKLN
jgi:hypothetical protein